MTLQAMECWILMLDRASLQPVTHCVQTKLQAAVIDDMHGECDVVCAT